MSYDDAADELYGLVPAEFTAARNDQVRRARDAGDRELARRIGALRKPTQAAWLVNLLWRERRDRFEELLELGAAFREGQDRPSAEEMRRFTTQRQRLVAELAAHATALAEDAGVSPSAGTMRDVESTLEASAADPEAADACRTGRLTEPLTYAGFGPAGFGGPAASASTAPAQRRRPAKPRETDGEDRRQAAEARLAEAREDAEHAERELDEQEEAVESAASRRDEVEARIERLRRELHDLERDLARLERELRSERTRRDRAAAAHDRAQERLRAAEKALRDLS